MNMSQKGVQNRSGIEKSLVEKNNARAKESEQQKIKLEGFSQEGY